MPDPIQPDPAAGSPKADEGTIVTPPAAATPSAAVAKPEDKPAGSEPKLELKLPKDSLLDQAEFDSLSSYAKEKGLSAEQAQGIIEGENARRATFVDKQKKQNEEAWKKQTEAWTNDWKNDAEIGGPEFEKNAELAKRVIDRFGSESLKKELNETGFGNHPELGRLLVKLGKAMTEDTLKLPGGVPPGQQKKSTADVLYPNQKE